MPNIKPAELYRKKMVRFESDYSGALLRAFMDARRLIIDIIEANGVKISTIGLYKNVIRNLEVEAGQLKTEYKKYFDDIASWYIKEQFELLKEAGEKDLPNVEAVKEKSFFERQQIYDLYLDNTKIIDNFAYNLDVNFTKLSVSDVDTNDALNRLMALDIKDGRASIFRLAKNAIITHVTTDSWTGSAAATVAAVKVLNAQRPKEYYKQAIAAIDHKTTDCCLRVHGQIQPLNKMFELIGTPRFADKISSPPFHWNCRTAQALYLPTMEEKGITTDEMRKAASAELLARDMAGRSFINPSHATSGR